jgi:hypothetical protein
MPAELLAEAQIIEGRRLLIKQAGGMHQTNLLML